MAGDLLTETIQLRWPRLLVSGVDYNDAQALLQRLDRFDDWCREWEALGAAHEALGDEALRQGHRVTAGEAFVRAAIYYHTGQSVYFADPAEKRRVQERHAAAYRKAMAHLRPPAEQIEVPFEGIRFLESERMQREASGVATLVVFPEGHHVCDNIPYKVRPLMADWMARQLRAPVG